MSNHYTNIMPRDSFGSTLELWGHAWEVLGQIWLVVLSGRCFPTCCQKLVISVFRRLSRTEWHLVQVRVSTLELLGLKSHARAAQSRLEGARQRIQGSKVGRSVRDALSEIWKRLQIKPEVKVYLSNKS